MAMANEATPWRRIVVYSLPAAGVNFMENLIAMFLLKFAADVLLLAPALVASFFGVARVWDALSDPIVGYWSDRTRLRMGRRRPLDPGQRLPPGAVVRRAVEPATLAGFRCWECGSAWRSSSSSRPRPPSRCRTSRGAPSSPAASTTVRASSAVAWR